MHLSPRYRLFWLFTASALVSPITQAAEITLQSAVTRALENNPAIHLAREKIEQDNFTTKTFSAALFPTVEATASQTRRKDAVANRSASSVPFGGDSYNSYLVALKAVQPLFAYGSLAAIRKAEYDERINEKDLQIAERTLTANVVQAYFKVLLQQNLLRLRLEEQKIATESLATAQARRRTGRSQLIDVLQVQTQIALLQPKIEDARNQLDSAASELANLMGENQKLSLEFKGDLPTLYLKKVEGRIQLRNFELPELDRILLSHEQLQEQKSMTLGKHLPNLKLTGDYNFANYTKSDLFDGASKAWAVQLLLTVPIFSGLSSFYERRALSSQEAQLEFQKRDVGNSLILAQIKSRKALESAEASLASAEKAAELAAQSLTEARRNFRLATIDFLQFLQVEQSQIEAISSLNQLKFNSIVAYTNYFIASGQPLSVLVELLNGEGAKKP